MSASAVVWTPEFLTYKLSPSHPLNPVRLDLTMRLARELGVLDDVEPMEPEPATEDDLLRVHDAEYLAAVQAAPSEPFSAGRGLGTPDNPIFDGMHEASALVCGGSVAAAREIHSGRSDRAVNIAGGLHHAMRGHASGFCIYNDCAVAIAWLLEQGVQRIAYVDIDVHHGDGVQESFYDDPRVLTISLHQHPRTLFPGTGSPSEIGRGEAAGTSVNVALPPDTGDRGWLRAFHAVVPPLLAAFGPDVLVTQCGADTHAEDPLANLQVSVDGHRASYQALRELAGSTAGGKWLALGGGGYGLFGAVPRSWTHLLATVLDRDVDPETPLPDQWLRHAASLTDMPLPRAMTDHGKVDFEPWGSGSDPVDPAIREARRAVFPLNGLEP